MYAIKLHSSVANLVTKLPIRSIGPKICEPPTHAKYAYILLTLQVL